MRHLRVETSSYEEAKQMWQAYFSYVDQIKDLLPRHVYEFACAEWHYSLDDPRSLHDSMLTSMQLLENERSIDMVVRAKSAFDERVHTIEYLDVKSYSVSYEAMKWPEEGEVLLVNSHGGWLVDEITLDEQGFIRHEIGFRWGAVWVIVSKDIKYSADK